ncbi:hypothetical protein OC835_007647 [Tilletia horrida]|nr:hypothetical protein OC835_007647 [Tilletia horrida]
MKAEADAAREGLQPGQIATSAVPARDFSVIRSLQKRSAACCCSVLRASSTTTAGPMSPSSRPKMA